MRRDGAGLGDDDVAAGAGASRRAADSDRDALGIETDVAVSDQREATATADALREDGRGIVAPGGNRAGVADIDGSALPAPPPLPPSPTPTAMLPELCALAAASRSAAAADALGEDALRGVTVGNDVAFVGDRDVAAIACRTATAADTDGDRNLRAFFCSIRQLLELRPIGRIRHVRIRWRRARIRTEDVAGREIIDVADRIGRGNPRAAHAAAAADALRDDGRRFVAQS